MARKEVGRYRGHTAKCQAVDVNQNGFKDAWCTYHAAYLLNCLDCGRIFHSDRPHTKYCSTACSQHAYRQRRIVQTA